MQNGKMEDQQHVCSTECDCLPGAAWQAHSLWWAPEQARQSSSCLLPGNGLYNVFLFFQNEGQMWCRSNAFDYTKLF